MNIYQSFVKCRRASVVTIFALALPILLGFTALVAEFGSILVTEANNQRVSDLASYAGALAYSNTSTDQTNEAIKAAKYVASLNGIAADDVTVTVTASPKTSGAQSVRAEVKTEYPLMIARVLRSNVAVDVSTDAYTDVAVTVVDTCILALKESGGTGVTLSGGTNITATTCAVNSNNKVQAPCGTAITAATVTWNTTYSDCTSTPNITATNKVQQLTVDPFIGNAGVAALNSRIATVNSNATPAAPTIAATPVPPNLSLAYSDPPASYNATGCTFSRSGGNWTVTCPNGGNYRFGSLTMGGGTTLTWATAGDGTSTYSFTGRLDLVGSTHTFGKGTYNLARGVNPGGGSTTTFDRGTYNMGPSTTACNGSGFYSICATGTTLTFRGPSTFVLSAGISVPGGYTLWMGFDTNTGALTGTNNLTGNSYQIGAASTGHAINIGGGAKLYMADASDSGKVFELDGNFNGGGGGSCSWVPAAAYHDIDGNVLITGAVYFGAGVYTVDGYMALGASAGGGGTCNGANVSFNAVNVNIMLSGIQTPGSGSCSGMAFCVGAGYRGIVIKAPTTGDLAKLAVIGPQSSTYTGGANFTEGGSGATINGAFYFPNGPVTMSGGASAGDAGGCLQVVGTNVTLTGGTTLASACVSGAGGSGGSIKRVQ